MSAFYLKISKNGQYYFVLKAKNPEVILTSELYKTKFFCNKGIESVIKNAKVACIVDTTKQTQPDKFKYPAFVIFKDGSGQFRFNLYAKKKKIIGTSEGYTTRKNCKGGISSIVKNVSSAFIKVCTWSAE